jgi:hypothetical protein
MDNENLKILYKALLSPVEAANNKPLFTTDKIGATPEEFQAILSDPDNAKIFYNALLSPIKEYGNKPLFTTDKIGASVEDFQNIFGIEKKNPIPSGFGDGSAPSPVISSAFAPVPGMGTYKEEPKPEEVSSSQYGKQLLAVGASGSRRATANVLSIPEFIYDAAGAPFRKIGLDVPKYDELSQGTISKYVNDYIQDTEKTVEQIKKDAKIDPQVEKGIIDNISKGNYSKAFQSAGLGIAESLPAMFLMALTPSAGAGAGIGAQVARQTFMATPFMAGKYQEIADDPTMSESAKILNAIVNGYAETIFEDKFGSLALIRQAQKIISKQGIEAAKDFTKKGFIDAIEKGMEKYFIISAPIKNAIEEGATQLTQNFSSKMTGEKPDLDLLDGVAEAMAQGGAFGLGISAIPATSKAKKWVDKKLLSNIAVSDNKDLIVPVLIQKIKDGVDAGTITQEEADAALNDLDLLLTNSQKVPANINREEKANAVEILNDRKQLEDLLAEREAATANLDPAFKDTKATEIADIKAQIEEKNQLLKSIGNGEAPVSAEQPQDFTYYERDGGYFKKEGADGKEQPITKITYDFETRKQDLEEGLRNANKKGQDIAVVGESLIPIEDAQKELDTLNQNKPTGGIKSEEGLEQSTTDIKAQKADIEKRRKEELDNIFQPVPIEVYDENGNLVQTTDKAVDINKKYDAELAALETTKPIVDATKISKEPITQGGEQGDIVQREGTQEGQPQAGQGEGGTGEATQPETDNSNRPVSSEEEVTQESKQESKQEPIQKRAFIDIQEIEDKYPNLYKSLMNGSLRYSGANKFTMSDIKNLLVQAGKKFFEDAGSATDYLNTQIDIENILETLYEPLAENVTKEQFKQKLVDSKDFTKNELGIFNALIDTLSVDQMPIYLLNKGDIKRISGRVTANFYAFSKNIIVSKQADAFIHEIGHFAYYNILSKEDRINYLKYMISTTYDTPNSKGKSIKSRLAYTSERIPGFGINVGDNFSEYFAEQFSQWYLNKKLFPKDIEYIFRRVKDYLAKVIEKLISGKYVDENLSDYFNKIIGELDKIRNIGEAKAKPEIPTELTKLEEKYNKDKKSLTKKELNDVLEIKRERRKKAMASIEKGNLSEEEVAIKKAAMQKLTDTMVEIIALIDKGKFKKVEADKEPTIKQKIKVGTEGGTTKTKAMTFSEYMRDRKRSFEEGYKKGTKDRAAQEQYRRAMLNVAIEYLVSKKLGKLKEAALRSLIMAASKVSNMAKLETFIKRVDLIMAKADFIEKYKEAKTLKKELDTNKKGGATQLIQRLKNINLDYLPESGIDKVIAIAKELNSKRPDMSTVIPNMKEVLDLEEAGFREAMRANYGELGLLGGSISKFMDNEEIYKNLKKLIEYQLISKEQVSEVELENAKTVLRNKLEQAYSKIKDFVDNKKTIDNLGDYLDIKKAIKAYNRTVRQIDQVMPEFAQKFELLTDADNEISQRLGKEIEAALKEFKEKVIKVSLNTSANLREYALSDAFKEESGLSPELNEILSSHLANFANNMDRETMDDLSVEDIADYTFFAEQALLGYISPEIYETYSKVGAIKAKNDTMQDLGQVMESDSKLQKDIAKINANYKGAKKTEDFVRIMTEYRKHNVDSFLGSGAVSLFYNNVYFPFGTNVTRMKTIIADLTSDFLKLDDEMNGISLSYGIPSPKILGGKKVISSTQIGKLLGSDKSIEDVKNTIMILLQQLDFITNLENPEKAKEKVYFNSFINNKENREALIRGAKDKKGMRDLFQNYENAIEIIAKLQQAIKNKNKTLSEKASGLITGKTAETLSKTTDAGVNLETISGVEEILNELANSNSVVKAYIDVIRKTIVSFESYTEMNTMMKGEQYYSLPNYMARQYVSGNLNTVSTSDKTAQLLSGRELFQRIKKNSSATYSREGDGLKPRIIDPKSALMMHANDVMMEYSLKGIMEASLDGMALAEKQATTKGEKDFLAACKESMNLMLETEFVTSRAEGLPKMVSEILNLQTTLLVGNSLRQPADYIGNVSKVATSVEGAEVFIKKIAEKLGTLQFLENGNSNLKELQERDKAAYELASMLGGELLWSEMEKKASQASGSIGGEQIMGNKTIKLAWADRLIVSNVYLPLFIKYFEQSAKKNFNPKEFNENPQKYYLDNLKALQVATKQADKYISKTQVSKNPLTKPEIVSLLGFKLKRDALHTRLLFSLTGYNANDSEVIKSILMDLYHGNGNRGLKLAQLSSRVSRSAVSNVVYMSIYKIIFGTLAVLIQSGIGFFDDDDDKEFAKLLVKEWDEFYQQYLTKEGLQQDLLGSFATMLTGQYQNIVRPVVNAGLFAAMKAGLLGNKTKMSEDKYKKIIRSTRSANFFTKQYAPKYEVGTVIALEAAGVLGLSYTASMAGENAMTISNSLGKAFSDTEKNTDIDFIAVTTAALQLANASAMIMGSGYGSGTYNKVYDQVKREVREEQRKQKPANVQSIQSVLRAKPAMKRYNPLKP